VIARVCIEESELVEAQMSKTGVLSLCQDLEEARGILQCLAEVIWPVKDAKVDLQAGDPVLPSEGGWKASESHPVEGAVDKCRRVRGIVVQLDGHNTQALQAINKPCEKLVALL
jgi:hypothetical protein